MSQTLSLIFASLLFAGSALIGTAPTQAKQDPAIQEPKLVPGTLLSAADKKHLLEDNFVLVKTVAAMPLLVQKKLLGKDTADKMADPGQPYQVTDVLGPKPLPFSRLIYAGTSPGCCFVYNEHGGFAYGQEVSLYHLSPGKAVLAWQADLTLGGKYLSFTQLRDKIKNGKFYSRPLPKAASS